MWFFLVISSAALSQPQERDHKHREAFPHSLGSTMSAALKDRDWRHTSRENNPSFPLDLLLEGLIKEEKQLWNCVFSCAVAQFHTLGFLHGAEMFPLPQQCLGVLGRQVCIPWLGQEFLRVCIFPQRSIGITLGQICAASPSRIWDLVRRDVGEGFVPGEPGVYLIIFSSSGCWLLSAVQADILID